LTITIQIIKNTSGNDWRNNDENMHWKTNERLGEFKKQSDQTSFKTFTRSELHMYNSVKFFLNVVHIP
jgi:hypothetical protein